jgi:hypothetical protein
MNLGNNISELEDWCDRESESLRGFATQIADHFWKERERMIESKLLGRVPIIGCRVKDEAAGFSISWFRYEFYVMKSTGKNRRTNVHISKSRNRFGYSMQALFKYTLPEEKDLVVYCESHFATIRERLSKVSKLRQWISNYKKCL